MCDASKTVDIYEFDYKYFQVNVWSSNFYQLLFYISSIFRTYSSLSANWYYEGLARQNYMEFQSKIDQNSCEDIR